MKKVAVLGATGSIGKSALDVIARGKNDFEIVLLSAHSNRDGLEQAGKAWPEAQKICSGDPEGRERLLEAIAGCGADITINGISGAAGLEPSMAAVEAGSDLALANKETLVMAGPLVIKRANEKNINIIPVDSEHSAIFHLLEAHCKADSAGSDGLDEIILTASGGPFRNYSIEEMEKAGPKAALAHPTWNMGAKISIDSASMANKGLEVIEASRLFNLNGQRLSDGQGFPPEKIKVVIHPQSIVHSMIKLKDGELYAQLSRPDMRLPILKALYWPKLPPSEESGNWGFGRLDFNGLALEFFQPDPQKFPMLPLAYEAVKKGGLYPCAYNAANEAAVAAFLAGRVGFLDIGRITRYVLDSDWSAEPSDIASVMEADKKARELAEKEIK
ncbi:MAG: 1-deoxy-D-xylulose-5-phosphate reductoisomerase [Treponema sp.]|jgi:1-deoxy-D-xylulose-5-phosphate reductoisomerase|nr:1-deoxy-D-xylulose-5-phosphate reductoisomerase [Treponema sp.]